VFDQFEDCDQFYNKVYDPACRQYVDINCSMSMDELKEYENYLDHHETEEYG
jgi:hypothetical protein